MEMKTKTIQGLTFEVSQPFTEGHVVTEAEARALNQTRSENIGNNVRKRIKDLSETEISAEDLQAQAAEIVAEVDGSYIFTLASVSAGAKLDPYEREALKIARELLKNHLATTGRKLTVAPEGITEDEWKETIAAESSRIAESDAVIKAAKKTVDAKRKTADSLLDTMSDVSV